MQMQIQINEGRKRWGVGGSAKIFAAYNGSQGWDSNTQPFA